MVQRRVMVISRAASDAVTSCYLVTRRVSTKFTQIPQLLRIQPWVSISLPVGYRPNSLKFLSFYGYSHGYPSRYPPGIDQIRSNSSAS
ncbi:unnamed protein product, partial [Adineta ricciae]